MADTLAPTGAHTAAAFPTDPIRLYAKLMNSLSRCQHELRAATPCYDVAQSHMNSARDALAALISLESGSIH